MSLYDVKQDCLDLASLLDKRYEDYDITELADKYCEAKDANDDLNKGIYSSALILRFWYRIAKEYDKCKTAGVSLDDVFNTMWSCIDAACDYRTWQDPEKHTNAQACINQLITSRCAAYIMYESNLKKNKDKLNTISLDSFIDGEDGDTFADKLEDEQQTEDLNNQYNKAFDFIQRTINNNRIVEAIILDLIARGDVFNQKAESRTEIDTISGEAKTYKYTAPNFCKAKLIDLLVNLNEDNYSYDFLEHYRISFDKLMVALDKIKSAGKEVKNKYVSNTIKYARQSYKL